MWSLLNCARMCPPGAREIWVISSKAAVVGGTQWCVSTAQSGSSVSPGCHMKCPQGACQWQPGLPGSRLGILEEEWQVCMGQYQRGGEYWSEGIFSPPNWRGRPSLWNRFPVIPCGLDTNRSGLDVYLMWRHQLQHLWLPSQRLQPEDPTLRLWDSTLINADFFHLDLGVWQFKFLLH